MKDSDEPKAHRIGEIIVGAHNTAQHIESECTCNGLAWLGLADALDVISEHGQSKQMYYTPTTKNFPNVFYVKDHFRSHLFIYYLFVGLHF